MSDVAVKLNRSKKLVGGMVSLCFPGYIGKKVFGRKFVPPLVFCPWAEGLTEDKWFIVDTTKPEMVATELTKEDPFFKAEPNPQRTLGKGEYIVSQSWFLGKEQGVTIYSNEEDFANLIPVSYTCAKCGGSAQKLIGQFCEPCAKIQICAALLPTGLAQKEAVDALLMLSEAIKPIRYGKKK